MIVAICLSLSDDARRTSHKLRITKPIKSSKVTFFQNEESNSVDILGVRFSQKKVESALDIKVAEHSTQPYRRVK